MKDAFDYLWSTLAETFNNTKEDYACLANIGVH